MIGKGVCGTAAAKAETVLVDLVEQFPGHISCDGDTQSEIVVPIITDDTVGRCSTHWSLSIRQFVDPGEQVVGVIDIDCTEIKGFDAHDRRGLEGLASLLAESCDW